VVGDTGARGPGGSGGALTDRALLARRDKTTVEHVSGTFATAPSVTSTNANALSSIDKIVSERPDSLNLSSSFSRSVDEVECRSFLECGKRCCGGPTKCDCAAYALDEDNNRECFQGLRARQVSEARMLDADIWGGRIKDLGGSGSPERKRPIEAQKQPEREDSARRRLNELQIPALPTFNNEYHDDEEDTTEVQNPVAAPPMVTPTRVPHPANVLPDDPPFGAPCLASPVNLPKKISHPDDEPMTWRCLQKIIGE
jgi:hypothetical protein